MTHKIKGMGLAFIAVVAMAALSAPVASAENFHSEQAHTILHGTQIAEDKFTVNAGTVTCNEAEYTGTTTTATPTSLTVSPKYTECKAFGFVNATVDVPAGCHYTFTPTGIERVHITGCNANPITVTAFNCWVTVKDQTPKGTIEYHSKGAGAARDIEVTVNLNSITYTQHSKSFPGCANGTFNNGTYTGSATVIGRDTVGKQIGIWATAT